MGIIPYSTSNAFAAVYPTGNPSEVTFTGFGEYDASSFLYLSLGAWAAGTLVFGSEDEYGVSFRLPTDAIVKGINVTFATKYEESIFQPGSTARPFACIAVSNTTTSLVYTLLKETLTFADPFTGGTTYPSHTIRQGELSNLNVPIADGTLVALVVGVVGVNVTLAQYIELSFSGGVLFEWT